MSYKKSLRLIIGIVLVLFFGWACANPYAARSVSGKWASAEQWSRQDRSTFASESNVRLLFVHSPGCSHCAYQRPIISKFEQSHRDLKVTWARYGELNGEERRLIEGTSGHPVMVFYSGKCKRQVVGETPIGDLEKQYEAFNSGLQDCLQAGTERKTTTGSKVVCR